MYRSTQLFRKRSIVIFIGVIVLILVVYQLGTINHDYLVSDDDDDDDEDRPTRYNLFGVDKDSGDEARGAAGQGSGVAKSGRVDVFVVEEHHEVIPYWFGAANNGTIPKHGNTLIHIDGHSDMAPTAFVPGYPMFQWPSAWQFKFLMQRNDAFIQAASIAGLIDRIIWVWPAWDKENHEGPDYFRSDLRIGWARGLGPQEGQRSFCMCRRNDTGFECISMIDLGFGSDAEEDMLFFVPPANCRIVRTILIDEVHELKATKDFTDRFWLPDNEHVILDIDEDYYGVTYAILPLLNANVSQHLIDTLNENIKSMLCPDTTEQAKVSNEILLKVVAMIIKQKICKASVESLERLVPCKYSDVNKALLQMVKKKEDAKQIVLCTNRTGLIQLYSKAIVKLFRTMSVTQLRAMRAVGFCPTTTPKTLQLGPDNALGIERYFGICYGANTPENTGVLAHNPTEAEVAKRSLVLKTILNNIQHASPKVVTVCRSVRDGYTPRQHHARVERDVLRLLQESFQQGVDIHYDLDLLGGKDGWVAALQRLQE